jgi:hypothetical protein
VRQCLGPLDCIHGQAQPPQPALEASRVAPALAHLAPIGCKSRCLRGRDSRPRVWLIDEQDHPSVTPRSEPLARLRHRSWLPRRQITQYAVSCCSRLLGKSSRVPAHQQLGACLNGCARVMGGRVCDLQRLRVAVLLNMDRVSHGSLNDGLTAKKP